MRCSGRELPLALLRADGNLRHLTPTAALDVGLGAADVTFYDGVIYTARRVRAFGRPMMAELTVLDIFVGEFHLPEAANGGDDAHDRP